MKLAFVTIETMDLSRSIDFYTEMLGFTCIKREQTSETVELAFLKDEAGAIIELICRRGTPEKPQGPASLTFYVDNLETTHAQLKQKDVAPITGPLTLSGGLRLLLAQDPNGVELGFLESSPL